MSAQTGAGARRTRAWLPSGLIALVVIPGAGGVARLVERAIRRPARRSALARAQVAIS
jgi:hypothetical protein